MLQNIPVIKDIKYASPLNFLTSSVLPSPKYLDTSAITPDETNVDNTNITVSAEFEMPTAAN